MCDFLCLVSDEWSVVDFYVGFESMFNVVYNEFKYKVDIVCDYGDVLYVECLLL